ncbi:MAG: hypothetical protein L6Q57_02025 [Alphaproteobacteria bacterium]|nr:hypothetical protein [Alphaproteobacteria bacterium]
MAKMYYNNIPYGISNPRFQTASAELPGSALLWETMVNQSDLFAMQTAMAGKGGPFGAQLWLVNPSTNEYVLVGTAEHPEDSNAVVSKGIASAHAEAENLRLENREKVAKFLKARRGQGWKIVQISSGESCPSCRAKQILFAQDLISQGLIAHGDFYVGFKSSFEQTQRDAKFNDLPYDRAFRAIQAFRILHHPEGILAFDSVVNEQIQNLKDTGQIIYTPVSEMAAQGHTWEEFFRKAITPAAVIVAADGKTVLAQEKDYPAQRKNDFEQSVIVKALHAACRAQSAKGIFESWNLQSATIYTNFRDIGPLGYAEALWCNIAGIKVIKDFTHPEHEDSAREIRVVKNEKELSNRDLFARVATDYGDALSPIQARFLGNSEQPEPGSISKFHAGPMSVAHAFWAAHLMKEDLLRAQEERLRKLRGIMAITKPGMSFRFIDGSLLELEKFVQHSTLNSHYDGKQAKPPTPALGVA